MKFITNEIQMSLLYEWATVSLIPLLLGAILYPLLRVFRKSWVFLLLLVTPLSFLALYLREKAFGEAVFVDAIVVSVMGVVFGLAVLALVFVYKSKWLRAFPKGDTLERNYKVREKISLRHLIAMGILMEERGIDLYGKLAAKASDASVRSLVQRLAEDEVRHKKLLETTLSRWLYYPVDVRSIIFFKEEMGERGILSNPPSAESSEEYIVEYALEMEKKMADFYNSFKNVYPEAWKRLNVERLIEEEKKHAEDLLATYPKLRGASL